MFEGCRLETCQGEDGPVVVKTATDDEGRARLSREADRLEQARHPGVVDLLTADGDDGRLVLAWAGDQTLALVRPTVPVTAALLAAVASTVADLHELGLIHGRLEPNHVIIGADGRPRLCGLAGRDPAERPATPADDVAALGHLVDHLLGTGAELEPIPERRWARRRPVSHDRRALLAVADRATQEDPAQRPTARALALLIADAVPSARLDRPAIPPAPSAPVLPAAPAALGAEEPAGERPPPAGVEPDSRPVVEQTDPAADQVTRAGARPWSVPLAVAPSPRPAAPAPADLAPPTGRDERVEVDLDAEREAPTETDSEPPAELPAELPDGPRFLGLRIEPGSTVGAFARVADVPESRPDGSTPRPARALVDGTPSRHHPVPQVAAAVLAVAVVAVVAFAGGWLRLGPPPSTATPVAGPTTIGPVITEPAAEPPPTTVAATAGDVPCLRATGPAVDLDGDGCPEPYRVDGTAILVGGQRWTVGQAGDRVALGDWDCDGQATPGLVRPATGEVFLFARWPDGDQPVTVAPAALLTGARRFVPEAPDQACGPPQVELADGRDVAVQTEEAQP